MEEARATRKEWETKDRTGGNLRAKEIAAYKELALAVWVENVQEHMLHTLWLTDLF